MPTRKIYKALYTSDGKKTYNEDAVNGTNLGLEFVKNNLTYTTICTALPKFDFDTGICKVAYTQYVNIDGRFAYLNDIIKTIDEHVYRNGNISDPYFGAEVPSTDPNAIPNTKFFFNFAITNPIVSIGEFIYREIEGFELPNF